MSTHPPSARAWAPSTRATPSSDPPGFYRGLALALLISLALWAGILAAAWWLWRG